MVCSELSPIEPNAILTQVLTLLLPLLFDQLKYGEHPPLPNSPFSQIPHISCGTSLSLISFDPTLDLHILKRAQTCYGMARTDITRAVQ